MIDKKIVEIDSEIECAISGYGLSIALGLAKEYLENETRLLDHEIEGLLDNYSLRVSPGEIGRAFSIFDRTEMHKVGINVDIPHGSWYMQFGNTLRIVNRGE